MRDKDTFRHESLQDPKTIAELLKSITKGVGKGRLTFSDEDGEIVLEPEGLLNLKVTAEREDMRHRLTVRITWNPQEKPQTKKPLSVD
jgi:amphi-Trp domain-containing protein